MYPEPLNKYPFDKTKRLSGRRKAVTIIAGFKSYEGIVLCADTQETLEHSKRNIPKLRFEPKNKRGFPEQVSPDDLAVAFCGAGDGPFIDKLASEAWEEASIATSLDEACEAIEVSIKNTYKEFGAIYQQGMCPEVQLIFGVKMHRKSRLFSAMGPIVNEKSGYDCGGVGHYMADFLASRMYKEYLPIHQCVILAAYILFQSKEHVDGCGGDNQIVVLREDGSSGAVDWKRISAIMELLGKSDLEISELLLKGII
jgi:20S proteasome alpha/beta subunit